MRTKASTLFAQRARCPFDVNPGEKGHGGTVMVEAKTMARLRQWTLGIIVLVCGLASAASLKADQVYTVNLIVQGSLAVGFDSVTNEVFGFDTIRLKENNLRIHFEDTSSVPGFPVNDWRILINDTAFEGLEYFAIEDSTAGIVPFTIRAGARTNALYVDAVGRVGLGTTNPAAELHTIGSAFISQTLQTGSSRESKEAIRDLSLPEARSALNDMTPVYYRYKADAEQQLGFIAEDVPDLVATKSRKSVIPMDFVAVLTKVVQDHERRKSELQKAIRSQQVLLESMTARVAEMEERANIASPTR